MSKILLTGTTPEGTPYNASYNSYYLAVVQKNKLTKEGYDVMIYEPDISNKNLNASSRDVNGVKYTKVEKKMIKEMKPKRQRIRVFTSNMK